MKITLIILSIFLLFSACSTEPKVSLKAFPKLQLQKVDFQNLPHFEDVNFEDSLKLFIKNCQTKNAQIIYGNLCQQAAKVEDAKSFFIKNFQVYMIVDEIKENKGLLTGYYEAEIKASYKQTNKYKYPIYETPEDMYVVDLSKVYPELKNYRLRGRVEGNKIVPYYSRKEAKQRDLNASVICYCDSKIDKFFLEVQGSGVATFDDNSTIYIGYANQNGHKYRSIGRYLIKNKEISRNKISLQSITKWLKEHPDRLDEVLNYNDSMVFFSQRKQGATGALGVELTPMHSIAVDKRYILLGSMLYFNADAQKDNLHNIVFAQDTGGAIKGALRADLFVGRGLKARELAGKLKAPLQLWLILPKKSREVYE